MKAFRIAEPSVVLFQPLLGSFVIIDGTILFHRLRLFDFPKTAQPFGSSRIKAFQIAESYGIRIEVLVLPDVLIDRTAILLRSLVKMPQNGVSILPVPRSGLSTISSDLQNDWKSLYWSDVVIDGTAILLRSLVKMPQNGVSIFSILPCQLSEPNTPLFLSLPSYHSFPLLFILPTLYSINFSFPR